MAAISVLQRIGEALNKCNFPSFCLKPLQVKCLEYILNGNDVIAILPTGFGKSLVYQLLPDFLPCKGKQNIVIVISPLNSIIEDQIKVLEERNIPTDVLDILSENSEIEGLFSSARPELETSQNILNGEMKILFAHPEALLSTEGRKLLKSDVFQENVVACVVDEAHCVELWGQEFRTAFKELSTVRAFLPNIPMVALTATAPPNMVDNIKASLSMVDPKIISANPNRPNIYLDKKIRMPNCYGYEGYDSILIPIAKELSVQREQYPMTVIYMKLKYCGYAYRVFDRLLGDGQYIGESREPSSRLFAQFHSPQTNLMKKEIVHEIKKKNSRIRIIFATSALGMGVDAPHITNVIHIRPPSSIESYVQEIGRAGRNGDQSHATLYYNNSDISNDKKNHVSEEMKRYCISETTCLRHIINNYLGFTSRVQEHCCCICEDMFRGSHEKTPRISVESEPDDSIWAEICSSPISQLLC